MFEYIDDKKLDEKLTIVVLALNEKKQCKIVWHRSGFLRTEMIFYDTTVIIRCMDEVLASAENRFAIPDFFATRLEICEFAKKNERWWRV